MKNKLILLLLIIVSACSNPAPPKEKEVKTVTPVKRKAPSKKPAANFWTINSFSPKEGETEGRKYLKFVNEGSFKDSTGTGKYLYAEVLVSKKNAGILLHKLKKGSPVEKLSYPVRIDMTNSSGQVIHLTSGRRWNSSGGTLIESNNNDYSQLRIFLLQSTGTVQVEIDDSRSNEYNFSMYLDGFIEGFNLL